MKLLDFGSLNIDHVYTLSHLVREGETLDSLSYVKNEGGKGLNQAVALAKAGAEVYFAGAVGKDGMFLLDFLSFYGVKTGHVWTLDVPTGHAVIQVDVQGRNSIILYGGANRHITPEMAEEVLSNFGPGDCVLLQNEISSLAHIIRSASARGIQIALNPSPITEDLSSAPLSLVDWFILNEIEGYDLTGRTAPEEILDGMLAKYPQSKVVLTLGDSGAVYADGTRRVYQPAIPATPVDSTAAGDTFTGYFLKTMLMGGTVEKSLLAAAQAASLAVARMGAGRSIPYEDEVTAALSAHMKRV